MSSIYTYRNYTFVMIQRKKVFKQINEFFSSFQIKKQKLYLMGQKTETFIQISYYTMEQQENQFKYSGII